MQAAVQVPDVVPVVGKLRIGPLKPISPRALQDCLLRHGLTTGNDAALALHQDGAGALWLQVGGADVTGYLRERDSFGLEACEESVEAFLREVALPGGMIQISGEYSPDAQTTVRSAENHLYRAQHSSCQRQRIGHGAAGLVRLLAEGGPLLIASRPDHGVAPRGAASLAAVC